MASFPLFDVIFHYKGRRSKVCNVDPDRYSYFELLEDVYTSVLSQLPSNEAVAIRLYCDVPGSDKRRIVDNDLDVLGMFYIQGRSRTVNLFVELEFGVSVLSIEGNEARDGTGNKAGDGTGDRGEMEEEVVEEMEEDVVEEMEAELNDVVEEMEAELNEEVDYSVEDIVYGFS